MQTVTIEMSKYLTENELTCLKKHELLEFDAAEIDLETGELKLLVSYASYYKEEQ